MFKIKKAYENVIIEANAIHIIFLFDNIASTPFNMAIFREETLFDDMWQNRNNPNYQSHWRTDLRISGYSNESLVNLGRPRLEKRDINLRIAMPIEKRVSLARRARL